MQSFLKKISKILNFLQQSFYLGNDRMDNLNRHGEVENNLGNKTPVFFENSPLSPE